MTTKIMVPFFIISPKTYLYGEELLELAKISDEYAGKINNSIFFSAPPTELANIVRHTKNMIITAQASDGFEQGRGMGRTTLKAIKALGVKATFINHMENQLTLTKIVETIREAKKTGIISIACANSVEEARALAVLSPDIILCEPHNLIGTGMTSSDDYVANTITAIKEINPSILVMEGAGIRTGEDVSKLINLGADGTGISSGLIKTDDRNKLIENLIKGLTK